MLASFPDGLIGWCVCTAYEIGKKSNRLPARVKAAGGHPLWMLGNCP